MRLTRGPSVIGVGYPFFEVQGVFNERPISASNKTIVYVDRYEPPPLGTSSRDDFNPLVHLEIEDPDEFEESVEQDYGLGKEEDVHNDSNVLRH